MATILELEAIAEATQKALQKMIDNCMAPGSEEFGQCICCFATKEEVVDGQIKLQHTATCEWVALVAVLNETRYKVRCTS
jgi:hypothetical protein